MKKNRVIVKITQTNHVKECYVQPLEGVAYESEEEEEDEDEEEEDGEDEDEKINELVNIFNHCILVLFYANQTVWFFFSPELHSVY